MEWGPKSSVVLPVVFVAFAISVIVEKNGGEKVSKSSQKTSFLSLWWAFQSSF
jgi:hypothetical protein